jgi:hypothetical protein
MTVLPETGLFRAPNSEQPGFWDRFANTLEIGSDTPGLFSPNKKAFYTKEGDVVYKEAPQDVLNSTPEAPRAKLLADMLRSLTPEQREAWILNHQGEAYQFGYQKELEDAFRKKHGYYF